MEKALHCTKCNKRIELTNFTEKDWPNVVKMLTEASQHKGIDFPLCESCFANEKPTVQKELQQCVMENDNVLQLLKTTYQVNMSPHMLLPEAEGYYFDTEYKENWEKVFKQKQEQLKQLREKNKRHFQQSIEKIKKGNEIKKKQGNVYNVKTPISEYSIELVKPLNATQLVKEEEEEAKIYREQIKRLTSEIREMNEENLKTEKELENMNKLVAETKVLTSHYEWKHASLQERERTLKKQIEEMDQELLKYAKSAALNDAFQIGFEGHFATINNFRLGKLVAVPVNWEEINSALGQCVFLLDTLANEYKVQFKTALLQPGGSTSKILMNVNDNCTILDVYAKPSGLFWKKSFNRALVAFLQCIREFGAMITTKDERFSFPYEMDETSLHTYIQKEGNAKPVMLTYSIKLGSDKQLPIWSQALKYMMTNLKAIVLWHVKNLAQKAIVTQQTLNKPIQSISTAPKS